MERARVRRGFRIRRSRTRAAGATITPCGATEKTPPPHPGPLRPPGAERESRRCRCVPPPPFGGRGTGGGGARATILRADEFVGRARRPYMSPARPGESHLSHLIPLNPGESRLKKRVRSRRPGRSGERRKTEGGGGTQAAMTAGSPSPPSGGEGRGEVGRRAGCGLALVANVSRCFASASSRD